MIEPGFEFFIPNKGLEKIWSEKSNNAGLISYNVGHLSLSSDGHINTLYDFAAFAGTTGIQTEHSVERKKINMQTGVAVDGNIPNITFSSASFIEEDGNFILIPNTNYLAYLQGTVFSGEAPWLPVSNVGDYYPSKIYENSQIAYSYYTDFNNKINANYYSNGTSIIDSKVISGPNFCHSADLTIDGVPLIFKAGYSSLQVHDFSTNTLLASAPINIYNAYSSFEPQYTIMKTRRSLDGTKIIGMIQENFHQPVFTSFVYNIANKTLEIKFDAISRVGGYHTSALDFDDEGNIYYPTVIDNYQIRKISSTGDNIFLQDFLIDAHIKKIRCAGNKLIVALSQDGNGFFTDDRGKGKLIIATANL